MVVRKIYPMIPLLAKSNLVSLSLWVVSKVYRPKKCIKVIENILKPIGNTSMTTESTWNFWLFFLKNRKSVSTAVTAGQKNVNFCGDALKGQGHEIWFG